MPRFRVGVEGWTQTCLGSNPTSVPPTPASQARLSQHSCSRSLDGPSVKWAHHAPPGVTRTE